MESVPESPKPPNGCTPTNAPVMPRLKYTLPALNSRRARSRCSLFFEYTPPVRP